MSTDILCEVNSFCKIDWTWGQTVSATDKHRFSQIRVGQISNRRLIRVACANLWLIFLIVGLTHAIRAV